MTQSNGNFLIIVGVLAIIILGLISYVYFFQNDEPVEIIDGFTLGLSDWEKDKIYQWIQITLEMRLHGT